MSHKPAHVTLGPVASARAHALDCSRARLWRRRLGETRMDRTRSAGCRLGHGLAAQSRRDPLGPAVAHSTFMTDILVQRALPFSTLWCTAVRERRAGMARVLRGAEVSLTCFGPKRRCIASAHQRSGSGRGVHQYACGGREVVEGPRKVDSLHTTRFFVFWTLCR